MCLQIKEKELFLSSKAEKDEETISEQLKRVIYETYKKPADKKDLTAGKLLKNNIIRLYPKLDLRKIFQFTISEIEASSY